VKPVSKCWALLGVIVLTMGCEKAESTANTITVTGTSSVRVPTDRVVFSVGVESQAPDAREAFVTNSRKVEAVVSALGVKRYSSPSRWCSS